VSDFVISGVGGGINIVLNIQAKISDVKLSQSLANENIIAYSILSDYLGKIKDSNPRNGLILGFACGAIAQLEKSAAILSKTISCSVSNLN
jgi:DNA-binding transcriptional MocR family regulator|tara:strand:+ start:120 stop:392 length:273 start_codon:yes stop_codon:yes gene_type:complete